MSEQKSQSLPQALHAMLARHAATRAVGNAATGGQPGAADDGTLQIQAGATPAIDRLGARKQFALEELMAGKTYTEAAAAAGVNRRTLYRWVNHDADFQSAMETWRARAARIAEDRLTQGANDAAATLVAAASKDFRAAALLLKGRGLLPGPTRQPKPAQRPPLTLPIPAAKRGEFEIRLRELILSFREDPAESTKIPTDPPEAEPVPTPTREEMQMFEDDDDQWV
jgi:hypothetical protein